MEEKVTIRLIRNATLRIHYAGKEILVDPMLAGKGTLQSALVCIRPQEYTSRCR